MSRFQFAAELRERGFAAQLTVESGETLALLGPNGAGKSTLFAIAAGLLSPDQGHIQLGGRLLTDTTSRTAIPTHRRRIALLSQQPLLFPHLTVAGNVGYGPRARRETRSQAPSITQDWLAAVDLTELRNRRPAQLSGGQAQRVAIARSLAARPQLLLLDEPFAALDTGVAAQIRALLRTLLRQHTTIIVTHDVVDALTLSHRVAIIEGGQITATGPTTSLLAKPPGQFAARLAGLNLLTGPATATGITTAAGPVYGPLSSDCAPGAPAAAAFAPSAVSVYLAPPQGSPRNIFRVHIASIQLHPGGIRIYSSDGLAADITAATAAELALVPGQPVYFGWKASEVQIYPVPR